MRVSSRDVMRLALPAILLSTVLVLPFKAAASPIYQIESGTLTVTGLFLSGNPTFDIRGAVLLTVSDPGAGLSPSPLAITDSTGGTDPGAAVLPFGNLYLIASDSDTSVSGIADILYFDFPHATTPTPDLLVVPAVVTPTGGIPGPVLATLVDGSPVPFSFSLSAYADLGGGNGILQWQLGGIGVAAPEPQAWLLLGSGFLGLAFLRRRKSAAIGR